MASAGGQALREEGVDRAGGKFANAATSRPYSGINIPILWAAALGGV